MRCLCDHTQHLVTLSQAVLLVDVQPFCIGERGERERGREGEQRSEKCNVKIRQVNKRVYCQRCLSIECASRNASSTVHGNAPMYKAGWV